LQRILKDIIDYILLYFIAKIDDYILEKSRVVHRSSGEKNFHVFYALFAGMSRDRLLYYFLEDPDCHRYATLFSRRPRLSQVTYHLMNKK
jgi:myosin heavy subunit